MVSVAAGVALGERRSAAHYINNTHALGEWDTFRKKILGIIRKIDQENVVFWSKTELEWDTFRKKKFLNTALAVQCGDNDQAGERLGQFLKKKLLWLPDFG